ncbi:MAG: hypothetical protein P4L45_08935, partial [Ignavibacteriaceae bacterium]|nr:hypothetical protein [Ignavibacteriaceae bacterium]
MQNKKLKLRGAIGIQLGLGLEEIEIDFCKLPPGLVAISGDNGKGKTTIIENLQPYRRLVSREGSLADHFYLKDSYRILEYSYKDQAYESAIYIDGLTKKQEAYLYIYTGEGKMPLNDGKVSTYDTEIERLFGSEKLFFNSNFSAQKSKGLAGLQTSERRELFAEVLGLDIYPDYCEFSKKQLRKSDIELAGINGQISVLRKEIENLRIDDLKELQISRNSMVLAIALYENKIGESESEKLEQEKKKSVLEEKANNLELCKARIEEINIKLLSLLPEYEADIHLLDLQRQQALNAIEIDENINALIRGKDRITAGIKSLDEKFRKERKEIKDELSRLELDRSRLKDSLQVFEKLIKDKEKIETDFERLECIKQEMQKTEARISLHSLEEASLMNDYRGELEAVEAGCKAHMIEQAIEKMKTKLEHKVEEKARLLSDFTTRIQTMKLETGTIDEVPCTAGVISENISCNCQFLIRAYRTKKEIPIAEQKYNNDMVSIESEIETLQVSIARKEEQLNITNTAKERRIKGVTGKYSEKSAKVKASKEKAEIENKSFEKEYEIIKDAGAKKNQLNKVLQCSQLDKQKLSSIDDLYAEKSKSFDNIEIRKNSELDALNSNLQGIELQILNNDKIRQNKIESIQNNYLAKMEVLKSKNS